MSLSDRLRPDVEAAPWVLKEVKKLEEELDAAWMALGLVQKENARLREALEYVIEMADYINTRDTIQKKARAALEKK